MKVLFFFFNLFIFHALVGQKFTYTQTHVRCYNFYVKIKKKNWHNQRE